jgi:hypothetical protein
MSELDKTALEAAHAAAMYEVGSHIHEGAISAAIRTYVAASPQPVNPVQVTDAMVEAAQKVLERRIYDEGGVTGEEVANMVREMLTAAIGAGGQAMKLTLAEAIACKMVFGPLGYPTKARQRVLYEAGKVIDEEAHKAASRIEECLCTACWGDGFRRISDGILNGPCEACGGSGRRALAKEGR